MLAVEQSAQYNATMHRQIEDIEEIARLDEERIMLLVENRELKKKLERKKDKIQDLKRRVEELTKVVRLDEKKEKEKELDEWIEEQEEKARLGIGRFDVSGRLRLDPPQFPC